MSGSTLGHLFRVTTFGESHGPAIGCVVDGCPPGLSLSEADIQPELDRRRPGTSRHVTQRQEADRVEILSGVFEGTTTGTPIALLIRNTDSRSKDYANLLDTFRPGHADYSYHQKYGVRDPRGGGRASARLTAPAVGAAAIAKKWLRERYGTEIVGHMTAMGDIAIPFEGYEHVAANPFFAANASDIARLEAYVDALRQAGDSCGARIDVVARHVPVGLGEPLYDKLDADIAHAMMGINAVKGVEIGSGFAAVAERGTMHGDELTPEGFASNHAGGVLGGISSGQDITVSIAVKPTSSIRSARRSIDLGGRPTTVETYGRHDPCVGIRATPIAEAMLALVLMDHALRQRAQCGDVRVAMAPIAARAPERRPGVARGRGPASDLPFAAVSFGYFAYAGLFGTYAPLWFQSLGYTTFAIGALTSMQSATRLFAPYLWGWVADHTGLRERLLRVAVAGALVASAGFFIGADYRWMAAVSVALFLCTAGVIPISESLFAYRVSSGGQLDVGRYGRVRMWGSIGFIVAVTASGYVLEAAGVRSFPALISLVLAGLLVAALRLPPAREKVAAGDAAGGAFSVLRQPVVAWFFAGVFLTVLGHTSLYAFYSLYLAELGYDKGTIGLLWALGVLVELGWFYFQGRWTHRLPMHAWLLVAALASVLRFGAIAAFADVGAVLVAAQCLHALSFAAQHSACIAVISRHFPGRLRGRGQALYAVLGYGFSGVIGGVAGGALSEALGFAAVFWAGAGAALAAAACCLVAMRLERAAA